MSANVDIIVSRAQQCQNTVHIWLRHPWARNELGVDGSDTYNWKLEQSKSPGTSFEIEAAGLSRKPVGRGCVWIPGLGPPHYTNWVLHICNLSAPEVETRSSEVQGHPRHIESLESAKLCMILCFKKKREKKCMVTICRQMNFKKELYSVLWQTG